MKPFRIFRPGKHTASCGTSVEFTAEDLKRAVEAYNPTVYSAPLVIGHPKTEDRAYGWAEKLSINDQGELLAHPEKVEPAFGELVESGAYRNRSVSWYMPDHPSNPSPGVLYPKHIGFLGAVPPALKGLGDVEFKEETNPELIVEFASDADDYWSLSGAFASMARLGRNFREWLISEHGVEAADKVVSPWTIEDLERQGLRMEERARNAPPNSPMLPAYNETTLTPKEPAMTPEQIAAMQAENESTKARLAQFEQREANLKVAEHLATVANISRSLTPLVQAGKVLPKQVDQLAQFMANLADDEASRTVEFGEAPEGGQVPKVSPRQFMMQFLTNQPKKVEFGEFANGGRGAADAMTSEQLAKKAGELVESERVKGVAISYTEAANRVITEGGFKVEDPRAATD